MVLFCLLIWVRQLVWDGQCKRKVLSLLPGSLFKGSLSTCFSAYALPIILHIFWFCLFVHKQLFSPCCGLVEKKLNKRDFKLNRNYAPVKKALKKDKTLRQTHICF